MFPSRFPSDAHARVEESPAFQAGAADERLEAVSYGVTARSIESEGRELLQLFQGPGIVRHFSQIPLQEGPGPAQVAELFEYQHQPLQNYRRPGALAVELEEDAAGLLEPGPEKELYEEYQRIAGQPIEHVITRLRPKVDLFFDKVLVNAPDARVRLNRLTLLQTLLAEFSTIADFSEIVTHS